MSSDGEVLEEDNTFVQYWDDWELVYYLEEVRSELASMEELLADTEEITTESDWSQHSSPQKPKLSTPDSQVAGVGELHVHVQETPDTQSGSVLLWAVS